MCLGLVSIGSWVTVCTQRGLCGLSISQSSHSIWMHSSTPVCTCHPPAQLRFSYTCSRRSRSRQLPAIGKSNNICQVVFTSRNQQSPFHPTLKNKNLDSPVLCWGGCWVTASLLEPCPMLQFLLPLDCRELPLLRPAAGEENLKPPWSSLGKRSDYWPSTVLTQVFLPSLFFNPSHLRPSPLPLLALKHNPPCCCAHVPPLKKTDLIKKRIKRSAGVKCQSFLRADIFRGKVHSKGSFEWRRD